MKAYDFDCVVYDGEEWCNSCLPGDITTYTEGVDPIFACAELDRYPVCNHCHTIHDYVTLTTEGRIHERICDKCDDQQQVDAAPVEFEGRRLCRTCKADILEERIDGILTDESLGWVYLGSDKNYMEHGGMWMQRSGDFVTLIHLTEYDGGGEHYQNYLQVSEGYLDNIGEEWLCGAIQYAGLRIRPEGIGFFSASDGQEVDYTFAELAVLWCLPGYGGLDDDASFKTNDKSVHDDLLRLLQIYTPKG